MANRTRENLRPKDPCDLRFEIVESFLPEEYIRTDIQYQSQRHLIMATDRQLAQLSVSRQWHVDGTFRVVKDPFYQLLSIHAFVRSGSSVKMVPLVFVLMSRRKLRDYVRVFRAVLDLLPDELDVKTILMDFELAIWKALSSVLPEVRLRGCLFHLTQAVWRKCVDLGLKVPYMEDDAVHKYVRRLMSLPYLPHAEIPKVFYKIKSKTTEPGPLRDLVAYFQRQWIEHSTFTPKSWSMFSVAVRTNNHVEGWNRRINHLCDSRPLGIYRLVPILHEESCLLPLQARLVSEGKLRQHTKRTAVRRQQEIFNAWKDYKDERITSAQLLRRCAKYHGPVLQ